jgi:hypothetical protein
MAAVQYSYRQAIAVLELHQLLHEMPGKAGRMAADRRQAP